MQKWLGPGCLAVSTLSVSAKANRIMREEREWKHRFTQEETLSYQADGSVLDWSSMSAVLFLSQTNVVVTSLEA